MKMKMSHILVLILALGVLLFALGGCAPQQGTAPEEQPPGEPGQMGQNLMGEGQQQGQMGTPGMEDGLGAPGTPELMGDQSGINGQGMGQQGAAQDQKRAETISNEIEQMNEIQEADTIVSGDTCIVAVKPTGDTAQMEQITNLVENKVKEIDPTVMNVAVSESEDIMQRVRNLANEMAVKPMNEIDNEIRQLMQKIRPQTR